MPIPGTEVEIPWSKKTLFETNLNFEYFSMWCSHQFTHSECVLQFFGCDGNRPMLLLLHIWCHCMTLSKLGICILYNEICIYLLFSVSVGSWLVDCGWKWHSSTLLCSQLFKYISLNIEPVNLIVSNRQFRVELVVIVVNLVFICQFLLFSQFNLNFNFNSPQFSFYSFRFICEDSVHMCEESEIIWYTFGTIEFHSF